ncbi:MAG TPA: FG-GAP-like repeat-containing protein [Bacteroidales bacterium]|nr:FG-GAP-like repeat-containing protein [Bacteroidales bacterium]
MKSIKITLAVVLVLLASACKQKDNNQNPADLITIKTLGLAYLEEFKLPEAEEQFLKFIKLAPKEKLGYANLGLTYLRMARYPDAEKQLLKAVEIDPADPDIRLILATVFKMEDQIDKAISQLKEALKTSPGHIKVLYELTEIYSSRNDPESQKQREEYLIALTHQAPENLVPRLNLTEVFIRKQENDSAVAMLEVIKKQYPDFPKEAAPYYNSTLQLLKKKDSPNAVVQFTIFHNYLKVTAPYQAGMMDLKGPGGSLIGFPLITFDQQSQLNTMDQGAILEALRYTDVTVSAGLDVIQGTSGITHISASDFDSDGDIDLYAGISDAGTPKHFLLSNDLGRFTDITSKAGLDHKENEIASRFDDFDNDGFLDLFVMGKEGNMLYRNAGKASFDNVTGKAKLSSDAGGNKPLFFDADHDGDLDLLELKSNGIFLYRNNGDGTFTEQAAKMGLTATNMKAAGAAFGDFDEDGDIDLFVSNETGSNVLFSNQREGIYKDVTSASGLVSEGGSSVVTTADINNDGFLDLFVGSVNGTGQLLYLNNHDGTFRRQNSSVLTAFKNLKVYDARFLDFDNDGFQDLILAGESADNSSGLVLLHNNSKGDFTETKGIMPEEPKAARQLAIFDYNDDGDLDLALAGMNGKFYLLRNDGGNNNHYIKMKLMGLKAGSAKNNHFGIGAKVEVRSGELYQTVVVTDPDVHFGLGNKKQADVVRITWTNGVPQNIFMPNSDQALIEAQTLKGSCPFLYTWNGAEYGFAKDILWRSALGMPLGIMGGTTAYGFADASDDYIRISGDQLKPRKGVYSVQVTSELWETIYFDELELIAADHPDSIDILIPEQFTPPPFPGKKVMQVAHPILPVTAVDEQGNDMMPCLREKDDVYVAGFTPDKYQGIVNLHELILDPGKTSSATLLLYLQGWIFPTDASINMALSQSDELKVTAPVIQVLNKSGKWVTVIDNLGFPMGKDKTVIVDLTGKFLSNDHRVKIVTNMEVYWDHAFFSNAIPQAPVTYTSLNKVSADLHYRGFSKSYRKGGRYGPHWFDYSKVDKEPKWRDLSGKYTRYGNVMPLLEKPDNRYVISNAGDEMTVEFDAKQLPPLPKGWKRDFLIRSVGWVKDGDLNTAFGNQVEPLPFHGMKSYTPANHDAYPQTPELKKYNEEYNTRVVTSSGYLNALKEKRTN